ncbi:hypothetical protein ALC60_11352, partial [Trachymyrmex zeteki]
GLQSTNGIHGAGRYLNNLIAHLRRAHLFDTPRYVRVNDQNATNDWIANSNVTPIISLAIFSVQHRLIVMHKVILSIRLTCKMYFQQSRLLLSKIEMIVYK